MSRNPSPRSASSWLDSVANLFAKSPRKASIRGRSQRRPLKFESLEGRALLSASVVLNATISGVVLYDPVGTDVAANETPLQGATVKLYQAGGSNSLIASTVTNSTGSYSFTNLAAGSYLVEQVAASGYVLGSNAASSTVTITNSDLQGTPGVLVDSFGATTQTATAAYPSGTAGDSYATASDAVGGARNMVVSLTSAHGAVSLGADSTTPDALDFSTGPGCTGVGYIIWQGQSAVSSSATSPSDPTGLNNLDLTSSGASTGIMLSLGADHAGTAVLSIYTDAGDWSTATVTIPDTSDGTASQQLFVPFSSFATGGGSGADFTNVGAIELNITGPAATDAQFGSIDAAGPTVVSVPNLVQTVQADLAIVKTASPSPVVAGNQLTYTLTATNNGSSAATGVTVTDTLPAGVTVVSVTPSQGTDTVANGVITVNLGNLADNATATTTVVVDVDPATRGTLTNTATISGDQPDPNLANNTSTVQTPVMAEADLAIVKTGSPNPVTAGNTLTYTLTATNNGPSNGTGVTVVDTLPAGVTYASSTSSQGTVSNANGVVTVNLGGLANGATATTTIVVTVGSSTVGNITNTATISGVETDPNMANNTATATTLVNAPIHVVTSPQADLAIVKKASSGSAYVGGTLTYTLTITNYGSSADTGVTVTDTLPSGETFLSASSSQGSTTVSNGVVHATLGGMGNQGKATVTIVVRVNAIAGSTVTNTASVTGGVDDPNLTNNQSSISTPVYGLPSKRNFLT